MAAGAREEGLRRTVAGMLSTIHTRPSELHPEAMLPMADVVIHHIRLMDSETVSEPEEAHPEGPFERLGTGHH